jgi:hypothetical protein
LKCDGTRAETRFRLSAELTSPFKSAEASVQSTACSRSVRISGSNAGYTMFRGSVKSTGHPLYLLVPLHFPSRTSQCAVTFQVESASCLVASLIPRPDRDCQGFASALETRRKSRGDKLPLNVNTVRVVRFAPGGGMWVYGLDWAGPG